MSQFSTKQPRPGTNDIPAQERRPEESRLIVVVVVVVVVVVFWGLLSQRMFSSR